MPTFGVVVAEFYPDLADEMLALARDRAAERGATVAEVSVRRDTPVAFGVTGPDMSAVEARERVDAAAEAVETLAALPAA